MSRPPFEYGEDDSAGLNDYLKIEYAPPSSLNYWRSLETRVMERITSYQAATGAARQDWWHQLAAWGPRGLIAASLIIAAALSGLAYARYEATRTAIETIVQTPRGLAQQIATRTARLPPSEAALQYVIQR